MAIDRVNALLSTSSTICHRAVELCIQTAHMQVWIIRGTRMKVLRVV